MRSLVACLIALLFAPLGLSQQPVAGKRIGEPSVATQSLPLRRVVLYSNGVAYLERRGPVSGNAEVGLDLKPSQMDDVLKSLVVLDLGGGQVSTVSYSSSQPCLGAARRDSVLDRRDGTRGLGGQACRTCGRPRPTAGCDDFGCCSGSRRNRLDADGRA